MKRLFSLYFSLVAILFSSACGQQNSLLNPSGSAGPVLPEFPNCRQVELVSETIPAGSTFQAGVLFEKVWVIRNTSPCNWSNKYSLVYYQGDGMGESTHLRFRSTSPGSIIISPGDIVTLTLNLRAPYAEGRQVGYWKLRDPNGILFVPDNLSENTLTVDLEIVGTVYSFVDNLCQAVWTLDGQKVACPTNSGAELYSLQAISFPMFEGHIPENENSIEILLPEREGSVMIGVFPASVIRAGDHLHLGTGCGDDAPQCDLTYEVIALTENNRTVIGAWHEVSDGILQTVNLDLSGLADQSVQFIFSLRSNTATQENRGFWFFPILLPY